jgi:predicted transcriptional regulator
MRDTPLTHIPRPSYFTTYRIFEYIFNNPDGLSRREIMEKVGLDSVEFEVSIKALERLSLVKCSTKQTGKYGMGSAYLYTSSTESTLNQVYNILKEKLR